MNGLIVEHTRAQYQKEYDEKSAFVRAWRSQASAVTSHRWNFAHAVTLAAMVYHFRKLTEAFGEYASRRPNS